MMPVSMLNIWSSIGVYLHLPRLAQQLARYMQHQARKNTIHRNPAGLRPTPPRVIRRMVNTSTSSQWGDWPAKKVRTTYLDYFKQQSHTFIPSSSTIPYEDPTLLFANAGMNQYKSIFLGTVDPSSSFAKLKCAVNSQKCIRAGGKHNDLDDVGKDTYHHTFFEMLGNWSFGDYFKREATFHAWTLLTKVYGLPADRLYVTYFEGGFGLPADTETRDFWLALGVQPDRILTGNAADNFWEMGATGPCGPCTEIHYDRIGGGRNASHLVNMDDPDVLEVWNLVFIQYNREDKPSNYDTDVFLPLFDRIQELTGARTYTGLLGVEDVDGIDTAYRVVADHVRTLTFAISDGGVPSNVGRGYVLRRVLRRGARYVRKKFGVKIGTFFSDLVPTLTAQMGDFFPEITENYDSLKEILDSEEESFARTLDRGEKMFQSYASIALAANESNLSGVDVWRLYDTYGFPVDLTLLMAEEMGLGVDQEAFEKAQSESKEISKRVKGGDGKEELVKVELDVHDIGTLEKMEGVTKTEDATKWTSNDVPAKLLAIYHSSSFLDSSSSLAPATSFGIILSDTPFYAEAGGQESDSGRIVIDGKSEFLVREVKSYSGYIVHVGQLVDGSESLTVGDEVVGSYVESRRSPIRSNHTVTHLLNHSLRASLGPHIAQKGSLVAPTKLRFDFSHKAPVPLANLAVIEKETNDWIQRDVRVYSKEVALDLAMGIRGLRAVFGEKYPDPVRVVSVGVEVDVLLSMIGKEVGAEGVIDGEGYSVEFCGGTHVAKTSSIKSFVIVEESGIAKGIRRIIAYTGEEAVEVEIRAVEAEQRLHEILSRAGKEKEKGLKVFETELNVMDISVLRKAAMRTQLEAARKAVMDESRALEKTLSKLASDAVTAYFTANPDSKLFIAQLPLGGNLKALAAAVATAKLLQRAVYLFSATESEEGDEVEAKLMHLNFLPKEEIAGGFDAKKWSAAVTEVVGGKGGGRDDSVQGVGAKPELIEEAMNIARIKFEQR